MHQIVAFHIITLLLVICYIKSILVHPGSIPEDDPTWTTPAQDLRAKLALSPGPKWQESKRSGERRQCKWCGKYKPDRCHHCRVCRTCILKMDHHCPWIYNCVGFFNHKYFFLLLFYTVIDLHFILWTMAPSVHRSVDAATP